MSDINLTENMSKLLKEQAGGRLAFPDGSYISQAEVAGIRLVCLAGYKKDFTNGANYYRSNASEAVFLTDMHIDAPVDGTSPAAEFPVDCIWECRDGRRFKSLGVVGTPAYSDWEQIAESTQSVSADVATALYLVGLAQSSADSKARGIEIKTSNFVAVVGGRYITESGSVISITDPSGTTAGQSYEVWIGSGAIWFNGAGTQYSASRFSIRRRYNGSAWVTPTPVLTDELSLAAYKETTSNPSFSAGAYTVNLSAGITVYVMSVVANSTVTLPAAVAGKSFMMEMRQTGAFTLAWTPAGGDIIRWQNNLTPVLTATSGRCDIFSLVCTIAGVWRASAVQNYTTA